MEQTVKVTNVYNRINRALKTYRYVVAFGGSSSSKSISILQWLLLYALTNNDKRIVISAESIPKIKKTVLADLKSVVMPDIWDDNSFNKSELVYTFPTGSTFSFVSADQPQRFRGMRQNIIYFDELSEIPEEVYLQADIRTSEAIISSFNPVSEFWIVNHWDDEAYYVDHSTYHDNPYLDQSIIDALESKKDINFRRVYVDGKFGVLKGQIFEEGVHWKLTDDMPNGYKKRRLAVDFGFSREPTAIVDIWITTTGELYLNEVEYKTKLINSDIHSILKDYCKGCRVVADSAEPKSIEEIYRLGTDIHPSVKGRDSINAGINLMKEYPILISKDSINIIKEFRNYKWAEDKEGNLLNKPIDDFNHSIDAVRYGLFDMVKAKEIKFI